MPDLVESLPRLYSPTDYLALEEQAEQRHEYQDGMIVPMTGGSIEHNYIAGNIFAWLKTALRGQAVKAYIGGLRVWIPTYRRYTYPDVFVIKGHPQFEENRKDIILNPTVIIEVLSRSTSDYDRGDKFKFYRSIPTFQEYWLIDQYQIQVDQYYKTDETAWLYRTYENLEDTMRSPTLDLEMAIQTIYEDVTL
ncbi:MAG: Uma2 family endonuclease [Snowella sp.]|nr:Uma2 family endonuclease [Snowella sp.]